MKRILCCLLLISPLLLAAQFEALIGVELNTSHTFVDFQTESPSIIVPIGEKYTPSYGPNVSLNLWFNPKWGMVTGWSYNLEKMGYGALDKEPLEYDWAEGQERSYFSFPLLVRRRFQLTKTDRLQAFVEAGVRLRFKGRDFNFCYTGYNTTRLPTDIVPIATATHPGGHSFRESNGFAPHPEIGAGLDLKLNNRFHLMGGIRYRQGLKQEFENTFWVYEEEVPINISLEAYDLCSGTAQTEPEGRFSYTSRGSTLSAYVGIYMSLMDIPVPGLKEMGTWGKRSR